MIAIGFPATIIMRLLKYAFRKSLLVLGYPKLEMSHPELGVFEVGAVRLRMNPGVPACQFFYPVDAESKTLSSSSRNNKKKKRMKKKKKQIQQMQNNSNNGNNGSNNNNGVTYYRQKAAEGLIAYLGGFGDGILQFLAEHPHPLIDTYGADPLTTPINNNNDNNNDNDNDYKDEISIDESTVLSKTTAATTTTTTTTKFPLVFFSHGLSGSMDMYSEICSQIASTGCVVVAVEHEDGTASYAERSGGQPVPYKRPGAAEIPYSRQKVVGFRTPMLEQRVEELEKIYHGFLRLSSPSPSTPTTSTTATTTTAASVSVSSGGSCSSLSTNGVGVGSGGDNDDDNDNLPEEEPLMPLMQKIVSVTDLSDLHLVGHSFGGATQLLAAQTWRSRRNGVSVTGGSTSNTADADNSNTAAGSAPAVSGTDGGVAVLARTAATATKTAATTTASLPLPEPLSVTVFDAWNFALSEKVVKAGLGGPMVGGGGGGGDDDDDENSNSSNRNSNKAQTQHRRLEVLSVLSEDWATTNPEREETQRFLRNSDRSAVGIRSVYARNSVHQSVCDTEAYLPGRLATSFGNRGRGEPRHRTVRALVREIARFTGTASASAPSEDGDNNNNNNHNNNNNPVLVEFPF